MARWPYTTQRWRRLRRLKLRERPLCEACLAQGQIEPATTVDHRVRITDGGNPFPAVQDLSSLCASCHNSKSRAEQMGQDYWVKGCDLFGRPLDPNHPWNREAKKYSR